MSVPGSSLNLESLRGPPQGRTRRTAFVPPPFEQPLAATRCPLVTESPAPAKDQLQEDVALAWSYAVNAGLGPSLDASSGLATRQRAQQVSIARWDRYAMELLHDLECDLGQLEVVAEACRARCGPPTGTGVPRPGYREAARLVDLALEHLRRAEAEGLRGGRARLMAELVRERTGDSEPYRQGLWHRHSWPRRLLRRVAPVWWYRRLNARFAVTMVCEPYEATSSEMVYEMATSRPIPI
jgi:hypothetical protein